ncbi:MAG TPA: HEAT repeat domain-containing protein [Planctomycetota bacterium]|nr:HEAT repeat domain-containing protein [Planctomycetota bacterium]
MQKPTLDAPRAWLETGKALALAGRRAGARYAITAREVDGLVGPLTLGQKFTAEELLGRAAKAAGLELSWQGEVALLQPVLDAAGRAALLRAVSDAKSADARTRARGAFALGESLRADAIPMLMGMLGDKDGSVRRAALMALSAFEGDFEHAQWAGRLSVFELPGLRIDTDSLMWVLEDAAAAGTAEWRAALSILGRAREGQVTRTVWDAAYERAPGAIMPAVWAMGRCGDPAAGWVLERRLRKTFTNVPADRYTSGAAMGKLGLVGALREHAIRKEKGSQPADVRQAAVYGLGFCKGNAKALETLKEALGDPDARVRELAVFAMGEMDTKESAAALAGLLADEKADVALRCAATGALARVSNDKAQEVLFATAKDKDAKVRAAVAEALGNLGGTAAYSALATASYDEKDRWALAAIGRSLASFGPQRITTNASPMLLPTRLLSDPKADVEVRSAIAIGMGQSRSPEWADALAKVALDGAADWRLREYAVRSLAMLANRAGQPTLLKLIESEPPVRMTNLPLRYLDLGDPAKTTAYLARFVTAGVRDEQALAVERIGELGAPEGVEMLAAGFNVFDNYTRCAHIWPLVNSSSPAVRAKLVDLLKTSRRSGVRTSAALGLGGRRDPEVIETLIGACRDENSAVRKAAAQSLGACGDPAAAATLIEVMEKDADTAVAHQALRALRLHEFAGLKAVREAFGRVRGTERDCGIPGGPGLREQPSNSWVLRKAPASYDDLSAQDLTYESAVAYEPVTGRVVQWGAHGRRADSPQTGRTWVYDTGASEWHRPLAKQEPPGICLTRGIAADANRGLVISPVSGTGSHGWVSFLRRNASNSIPWVYDAKKEQWYPMRPVKNPGPHGMVASCFDPAGDAAIFLGNSPRVYDAHANEWTSMKPQGAKPGSHNEQPGAYDPVTGRFIVVSDGDEKGRGRTWAYDLRADRWTELKPASPPPNVTQPMVYDSANDVMLLFNPVAGRTEVWAYLLRENRWELAPPAWPAPSYHNSDAAYDPVHNVTVLTGGWEWGRSGEITIRETWTYRYRPATASDPKKPGAPRDVRLELGADGKVGLAWTAPAGVAPAGYVVYRGTGEHPWTAAFEKITAAPLKEAGFSETLKPEAGKLIHYRVAAVGADGQEGPPSLIVRTQPLPVREVAAARNADGTVSLSWAPSASAGVSGYNVYRAAGPKLDLWSQRFEPGEKPGEFAKVNAEIVTGTTFTDRPAGEPPAAAGVSESTWAPFLVYIVRAVNSLGQESGPSPATLSIPAPPGPVVAVPLEDGRVLVTAGAEGTAPVRGRQLYRMDSYKGDWLHRSAGSPAPATVFVDGQKWPRGDRRCYFVIAVDELGQLGVPSSEAWARNAP